MGGRENGGEGNDRTEDGLRLGGGPEADDGRPAGGGISEPVETAVRLVTKAGRRNRCPNCGSRSVAAILYGYPTQKTLETDDLAAGELALGGCCVDPEMPLFRCHACGYEWRRTAARESWMSVGPLAHEEPLERLSFDAAELMAAHPLRIRDERKRIIASIAAPPDAVHSGRVEYTRWGSMPLPPRVAPGAAAKLLEVRDGWFDYEPEDARQRVAPSAARQRVAHSAAAPAAGWWVNFADSHLFAFYGDGFFAQDEVQVAEHPALAAVREAVIAAGLPAFTIHGREPTPVLVTGAERRVAIDTAPNAAEGRPYGMYGGRNLHAVSEAALRAAVHRLDPPTRTNVIAIAALAHGGSAYTRDQIDFMLRAAYIGFRAAVLESRRLVAGEAAAPFVGSSSSAPAPEVVVHSGFWGCGAFGGNRVMMTLLQLLAAQMAGLDRLVYHVGESSGRASVDRALELARELIPVTETAALLERVESLGLRWGSGDGN